MNVYPSTLPDVTNTCPNDSERSQAHNLNANDIRVKEEQIDFEENYSNESKFKII